MDISSPAMPDSAPRRQQSWLGTIRIRILAVVVALLLITSLGSVWLLRAFLFDRLDDESASTLTRRQRSSASSSTATIPTPVNPSPGTCERSSTPNSTGRFPTKVSHCWRS